MSAPATTAEAAPAPRAFRIAKIVLLILLGLLLLPITLALMFASVLQDRR